jgi:hypothetical protein
MKKSSSRRGSALILAVVMVVLVAGLGGAFLAVTVWRTKDQNRRTESAEAQQICDSGLELARGALLQWRNLEQTPAYDIRPPGVAIDPQNYSWNKIFLYCAQQETLNPGMGTTADPDVIKKDALARFKNVGSPTQWAYGPDNTNGGYNYDTTNTPMSITSAGTGTTIGQGIKDLFCINRRYGKGVLHIAMKNDTGDIHGDGVDNGFPASGNPWKLDPPQYNSLTSPPTQVYAGDPVTVAPVTMSFPSGTYTGSGQADPLIDGNGQAILIITATLPDGTQHQIEVLLGFPFQPGGPVNAIQDNGNINMTGAFTVTGTLGNVHANGNISGNGGGQANVSGMVGASGTNTLTMNNPPPGGIKAGVDTVPINPVDVSQFISPTGKYANTPLQANMTVFHKDGTVTNVAGTPLATPAGFSYSPASGTTLATWSMGPNTTTTAGAYYFDGNFSATGNGNGGVHEMTIIASGSVDIGGNAQFKAYSGGNDQLIIAGADIFMHGTGTTGGAQYTGTAFANEQVKIVGNFTLNGSITGANATDTPGSLVTSQSSVSPDLTLNGTPTVTYDGMGSLIQQSVDHLDLKGLRRTR